MKRECCRPPRASRGFAAIIEILLVAVLIVGGAMLYMGMMRNAGTTTKALDEVNEPTGTVNTVPGVSQPQSIPGRALRKAQGEKCLENLRELRMMVEMQKNENTDGTCPPSLESIPDSIRFRTCPVGRVDYTYDSSTGEVKCPFSGHEGY